MIHYEGFRYHFLISEEMAVTANSESKGSDNMRNKPTTNKREKTKL